MRAACYVGQRTLIVEERETPAPGQGEVEIEVAYTGVCGTDLHILHGAMDHRVRVPAVLGHEMSGTLVQVGEGVDGWQSGDRVTVVPLDWCDECHACIAGHRHVCHRLNFIGIDSPGSMQSRWTVPARTLVRIPDHLGLKEAALAEPTAVAVHDVRRAALSAGETALVIGGGPIGLLIALVARAQGAKVMVAEPSVDRRALAESLGITTIDPGADDVVTVVERWTGGAGAAVAFEVSGSVAGLESGLQALAVRGRMIVVAIHSDPPPVNLFRVFWRELTLVGARVYTAADFESALDLLASGDVPVAPLISAVEPLDRVAEAFATLESGRAMKVLIACSPEATHV